MARRPRLKLITIPWELEVPTLALASLAAVTPAAFDIAIVDVLREQLFFDEQVDLVGISASTPTINRAYALADLYRAKGVKVVMGGHHVTAMPHEALLHADAVVVGEGETAWIKICDQFLTNPSLVGGLYKEASPDPGTLPQPRIDLMKIERYGSFYYPVIGSRGCPEACSFCFAKRMTQGYRTYPIAHVLEQVRRRPDWVNAMYFVDDNLPGDEDWAKELFRALAKEKVPFGMQARHEFNRNAANVRLAHDAGCTLISTGYESVNQRTLDRTGKRALKDEYRETIRSVFDAGILPSGNWMFGFDTDGPEIFEETLEFLLSTDLLHSSFTTEIPFPGTPAFRNYKAAGRLLTENYDEFVGKDHVVVKPLLMSPEQLHQGVRRVALGFYAPRAALARGRKAIRNQQIGGFGPRALRAPALLGLNAFQVWQWHYRMADPLQWLYQRMVSVNRYQYFKDFVRKSNFWSSPQAPAHSKGTGADYVVQGPFRDRGGHKRSRRAPLVAIEPGSNALTDAPNAADATDD